MRSSPTPEPVDVLVIGGGITGLACALALAEAGARTLLVDAGRNAGSTANAGSLHVQLQSRFLRLFPDQAPHVEASLPLYLAAVEEWGRLDARHGPFDLVREGGLMVAETEAQLRFLAGKAATERRHGVDAEILGRPELERIAGWLGPQIVGAELCRNEGKLNPLLANARLKAAAQAVGVSFVQDRITVLEAAGGVRAQGAGVYRAQDVVVACSWGAGPLAEALGSRAPTAAEPLHMNITEPAEYRIRHLVQHAELAITFKQFGSGQIVIGGGWPARFDGETPAVRADSLVGNVALAARLVPGIGGLRVIRTWAGLNNMADGKTILGRVGRGVLAVPGDAGYTLGPLVGRAAAALALGQEPPFDPTPYAPARFAA